jgi:hypothetical protein
MTSSEAMRTRTKRSMRTKTGQPENRLPALPTLTTRAHRISKGGDYAAQHDADGQPIWEARP